MKKTLILLSLLLFTLSLVAQNTNKVESKLNDITSQRGVMIKFREYSMPLLNLQYGERAVFKIRKFVQKENDVFFLNIKNGSASSAIPEEDLIAIIEAIKTLKLSLESDSLGSKEYLENKYITNEGIQIGYYVKGSRVSWFFKLGGYGSNNTLLIKKFSDLESLLNDVNTKIQEIKNIEL